MKKYIIILLCIIPLFNIIYAEETSYSSYEYIIEDDANLLNIDEISKLNTQLEQITRYTNIIVKTTRDNEYNNAEIYSMNYYHSVFGYEDGIIFLIDMSTRYIWIYAEGEISDIVTSSKIDNITSNVYKYASKMNYYKCISSSLVQINSLLGGNKISEPMKIICNSLFSLIFGYFIVYIYLIFKTTYVGATNEEIAENCISALDVSNIKSIKTNTKTIFSPVSTSSGGHSGGGHSGGGHSGGGHSSGGHRF